jgi:Protein of unknown function (DUF3606)
MQRIKRATIRNKINLTDPSHLRAWTRRLDLAPDELKAVIEKVGNSVTAVTKEVELRRTSQQPAQVPPSPPITDETAKSTIPA